MTDTRRKTDRGDYEKDQEVSAFYVDYFTNSYYCYGKPTEVYLPGNGLIGTKINHMDLANNTVDIESMLRGTGSQNMVSKQAPIVPDLKYLKTVNIFDNAPVYMPDPLMVQKDQRPQWK